MRASGWDAGLTSKDKDIYLGQTKKTGGEKIREEDARQKDFRKTSARQKDGRKINPKEVCSPACKTDRARGPSFRHTSARTLS